MIILGVIPARGGSKGVPRKNIRLLGGRPLLAYTIDACQTSTRLTHFAVSTEDHEIAAIASDLGCDVVARPADLAQDNTPSLPVIQHATLNAEQKHNCQYDAVCLLQPTTPLRTGKHIDQAIQLLVEKECDSVISVSRIPDKFHPNWAFEFDGDELKRVQGHEALISRRQDLSPAYFRNGSVYVVTREVLIQGNSLYGSSTQGFEMSEQQSLNIDTTEDWELATRILN